MTVADYIIDFIVKKGVDSIFMITGGQAMFLNDAVYRNKQIRPICMHHEQAAGMSAEAYARFTNKIGVALVTAGPGAVNVMNGVVGAWVDSAPLMVLSGQSPLANVQYEEKTKIRQYGVQGINIKPLVQSVTKYFVTIDDPQKVPEYLHKAYYLAKEGRPGPVWLDVPLNLQGKEISGSPRKSFSFLNQHKNGDLSDKKVKDALNLLSKAKRPLFLVGQGVRISGGIEEFYQVIEKIEIPVLTSRLGIDLLPSDHKLYVGRPGTYGERAANFAIQNSDLIIAVGCRLATSLTGHTPSDFGRNAKKVVVDIDKKELMKPDLGISVRINSDAKEFFLSLLSQYSTKEQKDYSRWIAACKNWRKKYPVVLSSYKKEKPVNSYYFVDRLTRFASENDVVLVDTGGCFHVASQAWKIKPGQRFITTGGISTMGYWPAGIGVCLANKRKRTIVITGDGSLQMNIQEFSTIRQNKLPVKVFVFNNNGYSLIRLTQRNFMEGRLIGEGPKTGVWCPNLMDVAKTYEIKGIKISNVNEVDKKIQEALAFNGPVLCEVMTPEWQLLIPRTASEKKADGTMVSRPYEDMFPFLDKEELFENMLAKPKDR
ncbi:MAG: thiamine pyrophosphate-binding protein [bacterium]|nr:thiamine pyrophosphate-binding protein [bacterium]